MSDLATVALAVAVWLGALAAAPIPRGLALLVVVVAFALRRPSMLVVGGALLSSALASAAWAGLVPPAASTVRAEAVIVSDPIDERHALHVDLRIGGRRLEAWARGAAASALRGRLAGDIVVVEGRIRGAGDARARLAVRHVAGRIEVTRVGPMRAGSIATQAANEARRVLQRGAASLPPEQRALLSGFLIGDDRDIAPPIEADFRASGLTHLLAVSGQNLAFVLAAAGPLLRSLRLRGRLTASLSLIAFFAVVTRAEPSVLRASAMAAIACWSAFGGRPISRVRVLALAVAALVVIDPLLPRSVGFQLSVGASLGLALLAGPLAARLPGPRWLAEPLAVTLAAQAGVAPVLFTTFGGMPLVTPVANLLAVPIAGPLTAWGMTGGLVAGLVGGPLATAVHLPTNLMVGWIQTVAAVAARAPLGVVDGRDLFVASVFGMIAFRLRRLALPIAVTALLVVARPETGAVSGDDIARGAHLWRAGGVVLVLDGQVHSARLLEGLRRVGVRRIDLVVARRGSKDIASVLVDLRARVTIGAIAAPPGNRIRHATAIGEPVDLRVGRLVVHLLPRDGRLDVAI